MAFVKDNDYMLFEHFITFVLWNKYVQLLNSRYDDWFENYDRSPKIQIDGDRFDFVENPKARAEVFDMIDAKLSETGVLSF